MFHREERLLNHIAELEEERLLNHIAEREEDLAKAKLSNSGMHKTIERLTGRIAKLEALSELESILENSE